MKTSRRLAPLCLRRLPGVTKETAWPAPASCNVFISWWLKMTKPVTAWSWLSLMANSLTPAAHEKHFSGKRLTVQTQRNSPDLQVCLLVNHLHQWCQRLAWILCKASADWHCCVGRSLLKSEYVEHLQKQRFFFSRAESLVSHLELQRSINRQIYLCYKSHDFSIRMPNVSVQDSQLWDFAALLICTWQ